jgi:hypothetical protein
MTKAQWSAVYDYCTEYGYARNKKESEDTK